MSDNRPTKFSELELGDKFRYTGTHALTPELAERIGIQIKIAYHMGWNTVTKDWELAYTNPGSMVIKC